MLFALHGNDLGVPLAIGAADGDEEQLSGMIGSGKPDLMINAAEIIRDRLKARSEDQYRYLQA